MTKLDILILRACKTEEPILRLESIYRRYWASGPLVSKIGIHSVMANRLLRILHETSLDKDRVIVNVFDNLNPENHWRFDMRDDPYETKMLKVILYTLRYANVDELPKDFIPPSRFRRN